MCHAISLVSVTVNYFFGRSPLRAGLFVTALLLGCFVLLPTGRAVTPPPDGAYPNENTAEGEDALLSLTTGKDNTAIGDDALKSNTSGSHNTASGANALKSNTTADDNTAYGAEALRSNSTGHSNTASGFEALKSNTIGSGNTASGFDALLSNTDGFGNTASGFDALASNTSGFLNTASGATALFSNTRGFGNTAMGFDALVSATAGDKNTAAGLEALLNNRTGSNNTAMGVDALAGNTSGRNNIGLGAGAGVSLTTGNNNIDIGNFGVAGESDTIRIGAKGTQKNAFIAGIRGVKTTNTNAIPVVIDSAGQLGTMSSSHRFKEAIKPIGKSSEAILALRPVTFHYKGDVERRPQFGLIAEEVAKTNRDLVVRNDDGEIYTVRYDVVNAMLLNEFLKEHRKVAEQQAALAEQQARFETQQTTLEELEATVANHEHAFAFKIARQQQQIEALTQRLEKVSDAVGTNRSTFTEIADRR